MPDRAKRRDATIATHSGRDPEAHSGIVNTPVHRASTILWPTLAKLRNSRKIRQGDAVTYGVHGTPGTFALENAIAELEGGFRTRLAPSGLAAVSGPLLAYLKPGDHLLVADSVYHPTRAFCNRMLSRFGVVTEFYDPCIGEGIGKLIRQETRAVFMESPGSLTFEVQDVPAISAAAHAAGALAIVDSTWGTPLHFKPFALGADVSIHAATKYIAGHSDLVLGTVTTNEKTYPELQRAWAELGLCVSPDDAFLALRGLRSMPARLARHEASALRVAHWLLEQSEVEAVLHPALPEDPGHALWKRDFSGACGLFSFALQPALSGNESALAAMLNNMELFGMGYSWGGFESLILPAHPEQIRTATAWPRSGGPQGQLIRIHVGLEDPEDLIHDLAEGLGRLRRACAA